MKILETPRLTLRRLTMDDVDNLLLIFEDPIAMTFYHGTKSKQDAIQWVEKANRQFESMRQGFFAIELKSSGEFLGISGILFQEEIDGKDLNEIGYLYARKHWGKGYATEAVKALLDYGFNTLGHKTLFTIIDPKNAVSIRVAEKNGFSYEKAIIYKGRDASLYSITSD